MQKCSVVQKYEGNTSVKFVGIIGWVVGGEFVDDFNLDNLGMLMGKLGRKILLFPKVASTFPRKLVNLRGGSVQRSVRPNNIFLL